MIFLECVSITPAVHQIKFLIWIFQLLLLVHLVMILFRFLRDSTVIIGATADASGSCNITWTGLP